VVREGTKVWITPNRGGEPHPAIVIRVSPDGKRALVLSGTGTGPRDIPHVVVDPARRTGMPLRLSKKTYFYQTAVHVRSVDELEVRENTPVQCPVLFWGSLQELARAGARDKLSREEFAEWWPDAATKE
jgi:hypothetical protein